MPRPVSTPELLGHPELLAEVEYLFTTWGVPKLEEETLCHAPKLRAILHVAGSVRRIATDALWRRGIVLTSSYAINAIPHRRVRPRGHFVREQAGLAPCRIGETQPQPGAC
jgi:hypothetical protein